MFDSAHLLMLDLRWFQFLYTEGEVANSLQSASPVSIDQMDMICRQIVSMPRCIALNNAVTTMYCYKSYQM